MGPASSAELSPELERTLGDAIMEQGRHDPSYIADPDINQYLTGMGRKLASHAPGGGVEHIAVFAIRDSQVNAFALPGGYIGIHSGLVVTSGNESELASVMAHEIAHVAQRHIARGMTQQSRSSHVMLAALAGALLAALSGSGDLAMGVAAFGQAAAVDQQLGFSRQAEQEADRIGLEMLRKAGYDPRGMAEMFQRLGNASRLNEGRGGGAYSSTHPLSIQRMSDIQSRLSEVPAVSRRDSDSYWYVRAKLRVMQARDGQAQRNAHDALALEAQRHTGVARSAAWYGMAYAAWTKRDLAATQSALAKAREGGHDSPEIASLDIDLALAGGNASQAQLQADAAWKKWPESQGVALARVNAMQKTGQDKQAVEFLAQLARKWPDLAAVHRLKAQGQERLGQQVAARRSMATYYEMTGALPTAVEQLRQARGMTSDFYVQSELDVQIRTLKERLESDRQLLERFKS
ncbi:peptidase [Allopusillimonas ginsengisoli]|nr:peptidase [Allopusillimonas ginsengisoli]